MHKWNAVTITMMSRMSVTAMNSYFCIKTFIQMFCKMTSGWLHTFALTCSVVKVFKSVQVRLNITVCRGVNRVSLIQEISLYPIIFLWFLNFIPLFDWLHLFLECSHISVLCIEIKSFTTPKRYMFTKYSLEDSRNAALSKFIMKKLGCLWHLLAWYPTISLDLCWKKFNLSSS